MADVLHALTRLHCSCSGLELVSHEYGDTVINRTQGIVRVIEIDFKDCGRLIQSFHKNNATDNIRPAYVEFGQTIDLPLQLSGRHQMDLYFRERTEGLVRRKNDLITAAASLPQIQGIERFLAVCRTVLRNIQEKRRKMKWDFYRDRRDARNEYVSLIAKRLHCAETRTIW